MPRVSKLTMQCRQWRQAVIARLITEKNWCGHAGPYHLDCKEPRGAWHHITGSYQRVKFYEREARAGNLQVLCIPCHQAKSREEARARARGREAQQDAHVAAWRRDTLIEIWHRYENRIPFA